VLASATASAGTLELAAASHGSSIDLTFKNTGTTPLTFTTHVKAGLDHYDYLTVELTGPKGSRVMRFSEDRDKSAPIDETIKPGGTLTRSVDLALWSIHGYNTGGPLEPGAYTAKIKWEMPTHKLAAQATIAIAEAKEKGCKQTSGDPLELLAMQRPKSTTAVIGLHNTTAKTQCIYGIIRTHETQNDWLSLSYTVQGEAKPRVISLSGARNKSYPVAYELPPGATLWTTWDLDDWNKRAGNKPLPKYAWITATWDASREREVWRGTATTSFSFNR
jgi:hypothetical protein